jgi:predicted nucleotidyltransferase
MIVQFSKDQFGEQLECVVLYGSYARGDYDEYSDIDIMVLVDIDRQNLKPYSDALCDYASDVGLENDILVSTSINNAAHFHEWRTTIPFYRNVWEEGIKISA